MGKSADKLGLVTLLRGAIHQLRQPLTDEEASFHWTAKKKATWAQSLEEILKAIEQGSDQVRYSTGEVQVITQINLLRDLDFSGIQEGPLDDLIVSISRALNESKK